jgi:hypothetical protein
MNEPKEIRSGDTVSWDEVLPGYPSDAWTLKYRLLGENNYDAVEAAESGSGYKATITAAVTKTYLPGIYTLVGWVEATGLRYTVSTTTVTVLPDPAAGGEGADTRSHARKTLALIESAIESYAVRPVEELTVAGKTLRRPTLEKLFALRSQYIQAVKQEDQKERIAKGLKAGGSMKVTFGPGMR